ncbi:MAG: phosphoglucosamine mutase [Halorhodospira halophila]|uniref:phosphoglucosamine mutase n=1 Tax=Halorhodospira TaxID=85108 RepID=UPI0019148793|nr:MULTISPECIES: phosphoglucosamine mutase [Halorhodospira]MBK5936226.1 phosphoglucosamine mutase [Halorhodospira halophila]MBK5944085.1 phosphoglucosamine mutase [Halorhodospira halophila]MCC3749881.1 phosphoglucosamine mutase [Halorhodospira halophila]MCG5527801.1 phosphoglucosamine mutase [Halorhodospira halophila]MCG5532793.1 phosphoglucosamine mutase [Halorhodospira sp. 9621]
MAEQRIYFGTDGIRGRVGEAPITPDFVLRLGWAAGRVLVGEGQRKVVIGKDTRLSGYMFESALEAGFAAAGVHSLMLGPMPTPAIAYLTRTLHARAGVVISASHNPHYDNGIKFFGPDGYKLDDATEEAIERLLQDGPPQMVPCQELGRATRINDAVGRYIEFCKGSVGRRIDLRGLRVVVDCAHGATYQAAPAVLRELGAEVVLIGHEPDGLNINVDHGSQHPERLCRRVVDESADVGVAFDGDGDRVIMADRSGRLIDGDGLLYIIATARVARGQACGPVVGTQMTNLGLEVALQELGLPLERTRVGDRYVLERLLQVGGVLGGESSGHIICLDRTTTGDGLISALQVLEAMVTTGRPLDELVAGMQYYPQRLVNVPIERGVDVLGLPAVNEAVSEAEQELGERGRVLLRPSGTEPLLRVMVEGADGAQVDRLVESLAETVASAARGAATDPI